MGYETGGFPGGENIKRGNEDCLSCQDPTLIFVFGSNEAGIHGAGAARHAVVYHGALYEQGVGLQGKSYAIPTKNMQIKTLPLERIGVYVFAFLIKAQHNPHLKFFLTRIGCGLAGYDDGDIAPMFKGAPDNVILPEGWKM